MTNRPAPHRPPPVGGPSPSRAQMSLVTDDPDPRPGHQAIFGPTMRALVYTMLTARIVLNSPSCVIRAA
jgi:hypothetical protein